jgi:sterol desaturase/sphingolipid hydroxylase (fatty acid hydroxylase superfamily)
MSAALGQWLLGWLLADLLTGAFHWWEDRCGREDWPIIGPWLIAPNRLHHSAPLAFTRHGFWARNGAAILAALAAGAALIMAFGPHVWIASLALGGALANEVHRFAHQPSSAPKWFRVLQETGFVQSPKGHAAHHRPPQDVSFCVLSDWLNPVLEATGFWRLAERLLERAV